jgi:hypothetical protein
MGWWERVFKESRNVAAYMCKHYPSLIVLCTLGSHERVLNTGVEDDLEYTEGRAENN